MISLSSSLRYKSFTPPMEGSNKDLGELVARNWRKPAVSLFPELMARIFVLVVRSWGGVELPHQIKAMNMKHIRRARFTIAAICRQWREVALSTQLIWSAIMISHERAGFASDLFAMELGRSGDSLLSLHITDPFWSHTTPVPETISIKTTIVSAAQQAIPRCKNITITAGQMLVGRLLNPLSEVPLPNLESLSASSHPQDFPFSLSLINLSSASRLRELRLHFSYQTHLVHLKVSPDADLCSIKLSTSLAPEDVITIVAQSPSLKEFTWNELRGDVSQPFQIEYPGMLYLRELYLHGGVPVSTLGSFRSLELTVLELIYHGLDALTAPPTPFPLLESIFFPNLRVLHIGGYRQMIQDHEPSFVSFILAHSNLRVISVVGHITEPLAKALSALPSLLHLTAANDGNNVSRVLPVIRKWCTKARSTVEWKPPTLFVYGVPHPGSWDMGEIKDELDLLGFVQQIWVDKPIFLHQAGASYWDDFLTRMTRIESAP
ncbi:hypothetical protein DL93DRAFT_929572 [Clavulina sp. PMI_390]|nr:hypothetical protein DL93DRAFT_929572 [Clavulina sp. PMI_390]